jgi:hypothetical protein
MAAPRRDLLGGWRAWRAAEAAPSGAPPPGPDGGAAALLAAAGAAAEALAAGPGEGAHDQAERAALAEHYAEAPAPAPYRPGDPDPLRDGLLRMARIGRKYSREAAPGGG